MGFASAITISLTVVFVKHKNAYECRLSAWSSNVGSSDLVPTQLGFDPRLQLVHADDATGALVAATMRPVRGAVNVAPSGSVSLSRVLRLAGRTALPVDRKSVVSGKGVYVRVDPGSRRRITNTQIYTNTSSIIHPKK